MSSMHKGSGEGAAPGRDRAEAHEPHYTCPMHPEVRAAQPGSCPQCGMSLEAADAVTPHKTQQKTDHKPVYTCPMHPEV